MSSAVCADPGLDRLMGRELFERPWVQAPSSTKASDGLGPFFNARSCAACHPGGAGAHFETQDGIARSTGLVAVLQSDTGGDPVFGRQVQSSALPGLEPEGHAYIDADGQPRLSLRGTLSPTTRVGFRRAPTLAGRGLIAAVPDAALRALADPEDRNHDGISGRVSEVDGGVGRFGWKASHATLEGQIAQAFALDIGLSSARFPVPAGDCTAGQPACRMAPHGADHLGDGHELSETVIALVTAYTASLGRSRPGSQDGRALMDDLGCAACHVPEISGDGQTFPLHSDLLLHDMGPQLADGISSEWRTAPLIGLKTARSRYLHDGRADTLAEAIGLHGGEAAPARDAFDALGARQKQILIDYLAGL